jgi:hypothetical protein
LVGISIRCPFCTLIVLERATEALANGPALVRRIEIGSGTFPPTPHVFS